MHIPDQMHKNSGFINHSGKLFSANALIEDEYSVGGWLLQPDGQHDPEVPERGTQGFFADRR